MDECCGVVIKFKRTLAVISSEAGSAVAELSVVSGRRNTASAVLALSCGANTPTTTNKREVWRGVRRNGLSGTARRASAQCHHAGDGSIFGAIRNCTTKQNIQDPFPAQISLDPFVHENIKNFACRF